MLNWTTGPSRGWNAERGYSQKAKTETGHYHISKPHDANEYKLELVERGDLSKRKSLGMFADAESAKAFAEAQPPNDSI